MKYIPRISGPLQCFSCTRFSSRNRWRRLGQSVRELTPVSRMTASGRSLSFSFVPRLIEVTP